MSVRRPLLLTAAVVVAATVAAILLIAMRGGGAHGRAVPARSAVVWALGDGADGSAGAGALGQRLSSPRPDRFLYLGDVYEDGTAEQFQSNYAPAYGALRAVTLPTPGNHDWPNHSTGYDPYFGAAAAPGRHFQAVELAGWKIVSVNSEDPQSPAQLRFLRLAMAGQGTCRIVLWHRPRFSAGTVHGDDPSVEPLWGLVRGHAAIVLAGHEHNMQRLRPEAGTTQFISGAGGRKLYPLHTDDGRLAFSDGSQLGALRLRLSPGRALASFVAADGRTLDSSVVRCRPA